MKHMKKIMWEIILILASVFIFRSLWTLMDTVDALSSTTFLWASFILGMFFSVVAFRKLMASKYK